MPKLTIIKALRSAFVIFQFCNLDKIVDSNFPIYMAITILSFVKKP